MNGPEHLQELAQRIAALEIDVEVLGSTMDDLRYGTVPDSDPAPEAPRGAPSTGPGAQEGPIAPFFGSLLEFVQEGFAPVYCRATSPLIRWCPTWWDHAEAIYRLEALWRTWELYRLEPRLGIASWLRDFLDPQLSALTSPTGPFAQCTDDRHSPIKALRTEPPPEHYFEYL